MEILTKAAPRWLRQSEAGVVRHVVREFRYWHLFHDWFNASAPAIRPDVVLLPYLDYCLHAIGLLGSPFADCAWAGLAMRPSFHYSEMGVSAPRPGLADAKKWLFFRLLADPTLTRLLTIDEPLAAYLALHPHFEGRYAFLPEPVALEALLESATAKRALGLAPTRRIILVYGYLSLRKGVHELVAALRHTRFPLDVDVVCAGEMTDDVRRLLTTTGPNELIKAGRLKIIDRFVGSHEEALLFSAADIVWLGYRGHYNSSGVLAQAAQAGTPVLACADGVLGWQTKRHSLGLAVQPDDASAVGDAVRELMSQRVQVCSPPSAERPPVRVGGSVDLAVSILVDALAATRSRG